MTDIRELLTLAAQAMGLDISAGWCAGNEPYSSGPHYILQTGRAWNPGANSGQCADMCAALGIDTNWLSEYVYCYTRLSGHSEGFKDHNNDRAAAWRLAALRVAAEIGRTIK